MSVGIKCSFLTEVKQVVYQFNGAPSDFFKTNFWSIVGGYSISSEKGEYIANNGGLVPFGPSKISEVLRLPIKNFAIYGIWNGEGVGFGIVFLDKTFNIIGGLNPDDHSSYFLWDIDKVSLPQGAKYFLIQSQSDRINIESEEDLRTGFVFGDCRTFNKHKKLIDENKKLIDENKKLIDENKKLIDENKLVFGDIHTDEQTDVPIKIDGSYIVFDNGLLVPWGPYAISESVLLRTGETICVSQNTNDTIAAVSLTDLSQTYYKPVVNGGGVSNNYTYKAESDVYVALCFNKNILHKYTIVSNDIVQDVACTKNKVKQLSAYITSTINIANSDKIGFFSNSFLNGYCMLGKHAINNMSMFSDYIMYNFGHSGDDMAECLDKVNKNEKWLGDIPVRDWGLTYGIIAMQDNDIGFFAASSETYYENTKKLANAVKSMGAIPILGSEHDASHYYYGLVKLAQEEGLMFMHWGTTAARLYSTIFTPFWYNGHPATRTAWMWTYGMLPYIESLPRPRQAIKLFRVRPFVDTTKIDNLIYESIINRAELYEELTCGVSGLTESTEKNFDRISPETTKYQDYYDEYQMIQSKKAVSFGKHALIELITPYDRSNCDKIVAHITATGVNKAYIKKITGLAKPLPVTRCIAFGLAEGTLAKGQSFEITGGVFNSNMLGTYIVDDVINGVVITTASSSGKTTSGTDNPTTNVPGVVLKGSFSYPLGDYMRRYNKPLGEWQELVFSGSMDLTSHLNTSMDFDKVSLLLVGANISITDVSFEVAGKKMKTEFTKKPILHAKHGTSLLNNTKLSDSDTSWLNLSSIAKYTPVKSTLDSKSESLPKGISVVRQFSKGHKIIQQINKSAMTDDLFDAAKLQIRVVARYFPLYIDDDNKWAASKIKRGSFDCAKLAVKFGQSADDKNPIQVACFNVGAWWNEFIVETPYLWCDYITLESLDDDIQIALCEVIQYD